MRDRRGNAACPSQVGQAGSETRLDSHERRVEVSAFKSDGSPTSPPFSYPFRWTVSLCTDTWIFRYTVDATSLAVYSRVSCQELQELQGIRACT